MNNNIILRRRSCLLVTVAVLTFGATGATTATTATGATGATGAISTTGATHTADAQPGPAGDRDCPAAEIFATDNTAVITDPADPRLRTRLTRFGREVRGIIRAQGARPGASELLDGVYWSGELRKATFERSREFDIEQVGPAGLHHMAGVISKQYQQESVLTFRCLPRTAPGVNAVEIEAPGVSPGRLRDALVADPEARERLGGGSVTADGRLVLVAPLTDLAPARKLTTELGIDWNTTEAHYGEREFVGPSATGPRLQADGS